MEDKLIAAIIAMLLAAAGWLKSHSEVNDVKADREKTKNERDTKIALLEQKCEMLQKRLDDGQVRFDKMDAELKAVNDKLITIITKVDTIIGMKARSHIPEKEPL